MNFRFANIFSWLSKPFPFIESNKFRIIIPLLFGLFIYLFLISFQPFGIKDIDNSKQLIVIGYGLITLLIMLVNFLGFPALFKAQFKFEDWNILKELLFIIWNILIISICNWKYNLIVNDGTLLEHSLFSFVAITISVGIFPIVFLVFFTERNLYKKNNENAKILSSGIETYKKQVSKNNIVTISSDNQKDSFRGEISSIIYVASEGNYSQIFFRDNNSVEKKLIRVSMKNIEEQIEQFNTLVRCHRSYFVNIQNVKNVIGNARSSYINLHDIDFQVPVSRNFSRALLIRIQN